MRVYPALVVPCIALVAVLGAAIPSMGEPEFELEATLHQLQTGDEKVRQRAARVLAELPAAEFARVAPELASLFQIEAGDALVDALSRRDVDSVIGSLEGIKPQWRTHEAAMHELYDRLRERPEELAWKPDALKAVDVVPPELMHSFATDEPILVGTSVVQPSPQGRGLAFEALGCKVEPKRVRADRATLLRITPTDFGEPTALWIVSDGGAWSYGPAAVGRVSPPGGSVEVLDVDLDGRFDGEADLVRCDEGAFRPFDGRVWTGGEAYLAERSETGARLIRLAPTPDGGRGSIAAWKRVNEWRTEVGLPPLRLDLERCRACSRHVDYWRANGFSGHDQDPRKPEYSREGALAGRSSSVMAAGTAAELVDRIHPTILHRITLLGRVRGGMGAAETPGSLIWASRPDAKPLGRPILVPAPGQSSVPHLVLSEAPVPDHDPNYYDKPHGYPVSVTLSGLSGPWTETQLTLVDVEEPDTPLPGRIFSPEQPYSRSRAGNYDTVYFVAKRALPANRRLRATFTALRGGEPYRYEWEFRTK